MKHKLHYHHPKNHIYRITYGDVTVGTAQKTGDGSFIGYTTFDRANISKKAPTMRALLRRMTDAMRPTLGELDGKTMAEYMKGERDHAVELVNARKVMGLPIPRVLQDLLKF